MFKKLRNIIIIITMTITTIVLIVAGVSIMFFSSAIRPEPKPLQNPVLFETSDFDTSNLPDQYSDQQLKDFIKNDRKEGNTRLLLTLLCVGGMIEIIVFAASYYLSEKIVAPVKDSYEKQKTFIANASHELKTPLAVIEANMEALEVDKASEGWKHNIETEITHANKLVLDLLQLAKMDAGSIEGAELEQVDLGDLIQEHIEFFRPKFAGKISLSRKSAETKLTLPKQDFLQVLDILLDNATKYGDKRISVAFDDDRLTIKNDGQSIAKGDLEKVFDRFYQTDKTKEGSGLGLAIAKAICERNNWQITCESSKGTTSFIVVLHHNH